MTNECGEVDEWVAGLAFWQQVALDKVLSGRPIVEEDYDEVVALLLADHGLTDGQNGDPVLKHLGRFRKANASTTPVKIRQIENLHNVNALVEGQQLPFGNGVTAVYGANGSGKSGYSRVLGCAGFSRGDREVLGNIEADSTTELPLSADIEIEQVSDGDKTVLHYTFGEPLPQLSSLYVFDTTSVRSHLTKRHAVSFTPAGLSSLTVLAEVIDGVKTRLKSMCSGKLLTYAAGFSDWFPGESDVTDALIVLDTKGDLEALKRLACISDADRQKYKALDIEIARRKVSSPELERTRLSGEIQQLSSLKDSLTALHSRMNERSIDEIVKARASYDQKAVAAMKLSTTNFQTEILKKAGSNEWNTFVRAAKAYADLENASVGTYPSPGDICILCQQPLSDAAIRLLTRLWEFLASDALDQRNAAERALNSFAQSLRGLDIHFFNNQSVVFRVVTDKDPTLSAGLTEAITNYVQVRDKLLEWTSTEIKTPVEVPLSPSLDISAIDHLIESLRTHLENIETGRPDDQFVLLARERRTFEHRVILEEKITTIESLVNERIRARRISQISCSTAGVTQKYNQLFKQLISDRYLEVFQGFIRQLNRPLKVEVSTQGVKGKAFKRIVVKTHDADKFGPDILDKVLSEGEKRAVAVADFLTEVTLDESSGGIVLDDPVTSLDLEWREIMAKVLVNEARRRQVIIFTHDLVFLYFLNENADALGVEIDTHWIKRGDSDNLPGHVYSNNSPTLEKFYKTAKYPRDIYSKAISADPEMQELLLKQGFAALRTCYEVFIISDLFQGVVQRFREQISPGYLKDIVWDDQIVADVNEKFGALSRYIEGHSHSDEYAASKPDCKLLLAEIEYYEEVKRRLKELRKSRR